MLRADNLCNVQGPGDLFEMDEVEMDVSIVSEADQTKVIGRPIVHAMVDVYSRMIAAVSVSLENNSVLGFTNCLLNLGEDNKQLEFINYDVVSSSYMLRKMYVWNEEDIQFSINEQTTRQIIKMRGKIEDSAPTGFALLGYSGCGKSTSLKQLFDNIPQVIMHHPDPATNITQITYLVVSCMPNSNFATLYRQIGEAIDNALGYPEPVYELMITKKCRSLAEKQLKFCELIEKFSIGTIVLDEIQLINFNSNKENSYEGLLGIVNKTKIALSVVGTDEAYKKLFGMLRNARRAGEYINASAYTSDKEYFNFLLSMLLTWQWLDKLITKAQAQELSDTLYECTGGIINMLIWLYKWIMIEYLDNRSKGTIVIINEKFIKSVSKKHFGQLKGAIDMVNQAKVEEMEDEQILMLAESDKNKYEMPETNVENLAYESKMINIVIGKVHQIYTDVTSDDIARYVRQILAEDEYHRMKPTEVAKEVVAIITGSPTRKKRRPSSKAPASKNICDYISNT